MAVKTITRADLANAIYLGIGLSQHDSALIVEAILRSISDSLVAGDDVKITNFGTFSVRSKKARVGRNPKTGEEVPIDPRRVVAFRPSLHMKTKVAVRK